MANGGFNKVAVVADDGKSPGAHIFYASGIPAPRRCWNLANFAWQGLDSKYF